MYFPCMRGAQQHNSLCYDDDACKCVRCCCRHRRLERRCHQSSQRGDLVTQGKMCRGEIGRHRVNYAHRLSSKLCLCWADASMLQPIEIPWPWRCAQRGDGDRLSTLPAFCRTGSCIDKVIVWSNISVSLVSTTALPAFGKTSDRRL